jgi:hypothetical protein
VPYKMTNLQREDKTSPSSTTVQVIAKGDIALPKGAQDLLLVRTNGSKESCAAAAAAVWKAPYGIQWMVEEGSTVVTDQLVGYIAPLEESEATSAATVAAAGKVGKDGLQKRLTTTTTCSTSDVIGSEEQWFQIGEDLVGTPTRSQKFGLAVSISRDGRYVATGEI